MSKPFFNFKIPFKKSKKLELASFDPKSLFQKNIIEDDGKVSSLRFTEQALFDVYFEHYRQHEDYAQMSDQDIKEQIVDITNASLLLTSAKMHEKYIATINKIYNKPYVTNSEEFEEKYDLADFNILEAVESARTTADIHEEHRKNAKVLKEKYRIAKKNYLIPVREKATNRRMVACLRPCTETAKFWHEDTLFVGPEIISMQFSVRGLDFLESDIEEADRNANEILNLLLQFMVDRSYSDLHYYLHDQKNYGVKARRGSEMEVLTTRMNQITAEKLTEALLGRMSEDRKTTKTTISKKVTHFTSSGLRTYRVEMVRQSKSGIATAKIHRSVSIRLLSDASFIKDFSKLRIGDRAEQIIKKAASGEDGGIFAIAGETNSGKSTMLYAILYYLSKFLSSEKNKETKVITVDKVKEYDIDGFVQYDITDTEDTTDPLTLKRAIHSVLRQDPDIVSIGEIRSEEDFQAAVEIGTRGHPVFTTLHTSTSEEVINAFENIGKTPRQFFAASVRFIMHIDLVDAICPKCAGQKCVSCGHTGRDGRVPIFDIVYFHPGAIDVLRDDVYDFAKLEAEGKLSRITKSVRATELYEQGMISKETLDKFTGESTQKIIETFHHRRRSDREGKKEQQDA